MMGALVLLAALGSVFIIIGADDLGKRLWCWAIGLAVILPGIPVLLQSLVAAIPRPDIPAPPWGPLLMGVGYVAAAVLLIRWWLSKRTKHATRRAEHERARLRERQRVTPPLHHGDEP
jgi:hypothetical protein